MDKYDEQTAAMLPCCNFPKCREFQFIHDPDCHALLRYAVASALRELGERAERWEEEARKADHLAQQWIERTAKAERKEKAATDALIAVRSERDEAKLWYGEEVIVSQSALRERDEARAQCRDLDEENQGWQVENERLKAALDKIQTQLRSEKERLQANLDAAWRAQLAKEKQAADDALDPTGWGDYLK